MLPLFAATIFLAAALLFLLEPMAAKLVLPLLGGSPAVWNTCMVFFQAALLAGYLGAHLLGKLRTRAQATIYALAMGAPVLASLVLHRLIVAAPGGAPPAQGSPIPWLLAELAVMVGAPFLLLSAAAPLLQRWFSATAHRSARDPYFLYAASNAGSMVGLLGYPLLVEPWLTLSGQRKAWSIAFGILAILIALCGVVARRGTAAVATVPVDVRPVAPVTWKTRGLWLLLAFIPSSLTLGVTQHLATDIASFPLLWVLPLALYLVTFIIAFSRRPIPIAVISAVLPVVVLALGAAALFHAQSPAAGLILLHLGALVLCGLLCHTRLVQVRPDPARLTEFYLLIALGGVLGGMFNTLLAPVLFDSVIEYPIALVLALLVRPARPLTLRPLVRSALIVAVPVFIGAALIGIDKSAKHLALSPALIRAVWIGIPVLICLAVSRIPAAFALGAGAMLGVAIYNTNAELAGLDHRRTFFGIYRVYRNPPFTVLVHGTTTHGFQSSERATQHIPLGYYHPDGPIGQVFATLGRESTFDRVGLIGLGAGTLAAYGRAGQEMTFHEIDPADVAIARDPAFFTYLRDSKARIGMIVGDGRLTIGRVPDGAYGLIVLDAFSSDAIPVHLVTREAVQLYLTKLAPGGLIAFHISNRFLDLRPILARIADDLHLVAVGQMESFDPATTEAMFRDQGRTASCWVLLARNVSDLGPLARDKRWPRSAVNAGTPLWTDDYSNILSVFRWR